jgi:hypothetical protein
LTPFLVTATLFPLTLPQQFRQSRDVDGDPSRFVFRQHLRLPSFGLSLAAVDAGD